MTKSQDWNYDGIEELFISIANAGRDYAEACSDVEAFLPPDDSDSWDDADTLLHRRDDAEKRLQVLLDEYVELLCTTQSNILGEE